MGLREQMAADLAGIDAAGDVVEQLEYQPTNGGPIELSAVFVDYGRIASRQIGVAGERERGDARTRIPVALIPVMDQAAIITRVATGEEFVIVDQKLVAGVAWRLTLAHKGAVRPRGIK